MIHLHTHSMYSLRDSIIRPEELAQRLREIGQKAVAITDHGSSLGGVSCYKTLKASGIKYIHGVEFYICDDTSVKDKNNRYYHLVALCKNETGRKNMNRLISLSEKPENKYFRARIDFKMLCEYGEGLIILSACLAGEISKKLIDGDESAASLIAQKYKDTFPGDYYLEIQARNEKDQIEVNKKLYTLSKKLGIPCVVTTDAHYAYAEDREYQNKYAFNGSYKESGEMYIDCYVQSEKEVRRNLCYFDEPFVDEMIGNTHQIADRCNVEMPLSPPIMPKVNTPSGYSTNKDWLIDICKEGFRNKLNINLCDRTLCNPQQKLERPVYGEDGEIIRWTYYQLSQERIDEYVQRYEYELSSLERMGFLDYILLVYSYANIAQRRGIARGSGGGSLICYLSHITDIDPLEHGLYFERFIDVGALDLLESGEITASELKVPDIDLDFSAESCIEILRWLYHTYGEEKVASIGKFGVNKTKGTIRDMCRVLYIDLNVADQIAKAFGGYELDEVDAMISGELEKVPGAAEAISYVEKYEILFDYVRKLSGLPKSFGLHSCGKVISTRELDDFLPSCYDKEGVRYLQGDMHDVEDVGLVKIDVLGLRTIDQEYDALELAGEGKEYIDPKQPYNDPKVLDVFRRGDTLGIFQMASFGMKETLKKIDVRGIEDLSVANALYRPGAMAYINNFCARRNGTEKFEYLHPDLEPILRSTYGIIVYQEQLIEIGRLAGIRNPDEIRKATGKKNLELMAKVKPELQRKLIARGWSEEQFSQLWRDMIEFAKYSFNKSHSAAYAIIAYMTAKLKCYYPLQFYAGLCNSYIGKSDYVKEEAGPIAHDMAAHRIKLSPFNWRQDHRRCTIKDNRLVYAIPLIKDCNQQMGEVLHKLSGEHYDYFWRLMYAMKSNGVGVAKIIVLVKLGFFREFGNIRELLGIIDIFKMFKCGEVTSLDRAKVEGTFLEDILLRCSVSTTKKGNARKSFVKIQVGGVLDECERYIRSTSLEDFTLYEKVKIQHSYLGFLMPSGDENDRPSLLVMSVKQLHRKRDGKQFGYSIVAQSIGSWIVTRYTIMNSVFKRNPIDAGDIIRCQNVERDGKWFEMTAYTKYMS